MIILGINFVFHDSSACIVIDGELIASVEEERFTRQKHTNKFPHNSIEQCLKIAKLDISDVDYVAFSFKPSLDIPKKVLYSLKNIRSFYSIFKQQVMHFFWRYREIKKWEKTFLKNSKAKILWVPHHKTHAYGTFFVSPFEEAAIVSMDGSGEWSTSSIGYGNGNQVTTYTETFFPHSLGSIYEAVTLFCGFKPAYDEGKTMGLAPMGNPEIFINEARKVVNVNDTGNISVDLSYFNYQYCKHDYLSEKFIRIFGQPREKNGEFLQYHMDVAAAFQCVLEETALKICSILRKKTHAEYIVIAGGVALNSVMNGRIVRESGFKDAYIMPAAGDNGTSIGAAYYVYNHVLEKPRNYIHNNPYLGNEYSNDEIEAFLKVCKLPYTRSENVEKETAQLLFDNNIICWFQGRTEIGPRALGARSILADPTKPHMKDKINAEVKHREVYRPFAPSVIVEKRSEYFDIEVEAPFMLKVCQVKESKKALLPAITHVDGSARVQTVNKETNKAYHTLIEEFGKLSGIPVVLNTSFNIMGEPVVETPYDAIRCFFSTGLDYLVIGDFIISKNPNA